MVNQRIDQVLVHSLGHFDWFDQFVDVVNLFVIDMMIGLFVSLQNVSVAQPEPSTLVAACENIFLKRSNEPYSLSISLARAPVGAPPPPLPAGARFSQKI